LPYIATPTAFCSRTRAADEAAAAFNSCRSNFVSAVHPGSSQNKGHALPANVIFASLSARASHLIRYKDLLVLHVRARPVGFSRRERSTVLHLLTRTSNIDCNKSAEAMQKSMSGREAVQKSMSGREAVQKSKNLCTRHTCANICVGRKCSLFPVRCYSCSRNLPLSFMSASPC